MEKKHNLGKVYFYVYNIDSVKIEEYVGELHCLEAIHNDLINLDEMYYITCDNYRGKYDFIFCPKTEGSIVCGDVVWFREPNIKKAAELFAEFEHRILEYHRSSVETAKQRCVYLEEIMKAGEKDNGI